MGAEHGLGDGGFQRPFSLFLLHSLYPFRLDMNKVFISTYPLIFFRLFSEKNEYKTEHDEKFFKK